MDLLSSQYEYFRSSTNTPKSTGNQTFGQQYRNRNIKSSSQHLETYQSQSSKQSSFKDKHSQHKKSRKKKYGHSSRKMEVSLMNSIASVISYSKKDHSLTSLLSSEAYITEQILSLQEDKLTLMEQFGQQFGRRLTTEREVHKIKNNVGEGRDLNQQMQSLTTKNEILKELLNLLHQLENMEKKVNRSRSDGQRGSGQGKSFENLQEQLYGLRNQRNHLYYILIEKNTENSHCQFLEELVEENEQLSPELSEVLKRKWSQSSAQRIKFLNRKIDSLKDENQQIIRERNMMQQKIQKLKEENKKMQIQS